MPADRIPAFQTLASPQEAVDRLIELHDVAIEAQRDALERFFSSGRSPTPGERLRFRYPELRIIYRATSLPPVKQRAYAKLQGPGIYTTTVTQPSVFKGYLLEQLNHLVGDYGVTIEVGLSDQEILCVIAYLQSLGGTPTVTLQTKHHYNSGAAAPAPASAPAGAAPGASAPPSKGTQP